MSHACVYTILNELVRARIKLKDVNASNAPLVRIVVVSQQPAMLLSIAANRGVKVVKPHTARVYPVQLTITP